MFPSLDAPYMNSVSRCIPNLFSSVLHCLVSSLPALRRPDMQHSVQRYTSSFLRLPPKRLSLLCKQSLPGRCNGNASVRVA
jgi:hypothetical protein